MVTIAAASAYLPRGRLPRAEIGRAWSSRGGRGAKAVAAHDEDSLTMATAAALACLDGAPPPDAVWFASTTPPYLEKQAAAILAAALDAPRGAFTVDVAASLRSWTSAVRAAADTLTAGSAERALVATGEVRPAAPDSPEELGFGDGGGAVLLECDGKGAALLGAASVNDNTLATWRRVGDPFVQTGDLRYALQTGAVAPATEAVRAALSAAGVQAGEVSLLAVAAGDPRVATSLQNALELSGEIVEPPLEQAGNSGAALPSLLLAQALNRAQPGDVLLLVAVGDGADALVLRAGERPRGVGLLERLLADGREVSSYEQYLRRCGILPQDATAPLSSPIPQRREEGHFLRFHGAQCRSCGRLQYPLAPLCEACGEGELDEVRLTRHGTVYTYTSDYLVAGVNPGIGESPVTMAVIDLDDGARVFLQMTDAAEEEIQVGLGVEISFRLLHEGSGYHNYYWKARPKPASED